MLRTEDLEYELPDELIATSPVQRRDEARLLVVHRSDTSENDVRHAHVRDLPAILDSGCALVMNNTRVVPARFCGLRKTTSGRIDGLYLRHIPGDGQDEVMLRSGGKLHVGDEIQLLGRDRHPLEGACLELIRKQPDGAWFVRFHPGSAKPHGATLLETLETFCGLVPLPPYILNRRKHPQAPTSDADDDGWTANSDSERYQTVYAGPSGAVAAPTAGLHFTPELLSALHDRGICTPMLTLHVGAGTFKPVETSTIEEHPMHSEQFEIPVSLLSLLQEWRAGRNMELHENVPLRRKLIAVGTTTVRALESLPPDLPIGDMPYRAWSDLLITPGFSFRFCEGLMTNFHLPRSTLLALVAAFVGLDRLKALYRLAIREKYRFYSYGDAMIILP